MAKKIKEIPAKKPDVKILQQCSFIINGQGGLIITGLGDDMKMYQWFWQRGEWVEHWEQDWQRVKRLALERQEQLAARRKR